MGAGFGPSDEKGGVMFSNDFVIFDEAHEIPDVAGDHLGLGISSWAMEMGVKRIYNSKKRKGLIHRIGRPVDFTAVENADLAISDLFQFLHIETLGKTVFDFWKKGSSHGSFSTTQSSLQMSC